MIDLLEKGMTLDDGYVVLLLHEFYEKQKWKGKRRRKSLAAQDY